MKRFDSLAALPASMQGGAVTIGNFDGVHQGHARILARLKEVAEAVQGPAVVFTFDPHPARLLRPHEAPPPLTWSDRKAELLARQGIDTLIVYPTDEALLTLSAREFFAEIVVRQLAARGMVEGPNFYFGHRRQGTIEVLRELTHESGMRLDVVEPLVDDGQIVSSSRIRAALVAGDVDQARRLLTEPYRIRGMVTHGAARGGKIGFPTANLGAVDTLVPGVGVYAGAAHVGGERFPAAIHIGPNPTFGEHATKVEVHLIGFTGSLYGAPLEVDFLRRLRDVHPFPSLDALKAQLARDIDAARQAEET